jgi:hypothetical protein
LAGSKNVNTIIKTTKPKEPNAKIIVMEDFNDNPNDASITLMEKGCELYNPFKTVWSRDKGNLHYDFKWNLFDQILFSANFFDTNNSLLAFIISNTLNNRLLE